MQSETTADTRNFDSFIEWAYLNRVLIGVGIGLVVLVGVGFAITKWRKNENEVSANAALFALPSPLSSARKKVDPQAADFEKVAAEYPGTGAGERADLIAAGLFFTGGQYAESHKEFSKFLDTYGESPLRAQAAMGVAASLEAQGKINEAIVKYQEAISKYPSENIVAPARLTLARLSETQNKPAEALKFYDDLVRSGNPYDPWSAEAGERKAQLLLKHPELKPKPAVPATSSVLPQTTPTPAPTPAPAPADK